MKSTEVLVEVAGVRGAHTVGAQQRLQAADMFDCAGFFSVSSPSHFRTYDVNRLPWLVDLPQTSISISDVGSPASHRAYRLRASATCSSSERLTLMKRVLSIPVWLGPAEFSASPYSRTSTCSLPSSSTATGSMIARMVASSSVPAPGCNTSSPDSRRDSMEKVRLDIEVRFPSTSATRPGSKGLMPDVLSRAVNHDNT